MRSLVGVLVLTLVCSVHSLRVLGVFPHVGKSHFYVFQPLLFGLAERGHEVTVVSHFPLSTPVNNYNDISLEGSVPIWHTSFTFENFTFHPLTEKIVRHMVAAYILFQTGQITCEAMLANAQVQQLSTRQYDVVILEQFNSDCALGLVHKLRVPFIGIASHSLMPFTMDRIGVLSNPSFVPSHFLGYGTAPGTFGKIESFLVNWFYGSVYYFFSQMPQRRLLSKYFGDVPPLEDIAKNMSLMLVNTYHSFNGVNLLPPNTVEIGGIHLHYSQKKISLNKDLEEFLDASTEGVVVFSMGSMLITKSWAKDKLKAFQETFSTIKEKILWKWEDDTMENMPKNVKLVKWLPQFDVLRHKNVKVFMAHGGLLGLTEAVYAGVPVMAIPLFGDQFNNAAAVQESGLGIVMDIKNITKDSISWGLQHLLSPSMQHRAKDLSAKWKDRPQPPMETAIYWIEHVGRHGGNHMRSPTVNISIINYLSLDVILVLVVILLFFGLSLRSIVSLLKLNKKEKND